MVMVQYNNCVEAGEDALLLVLGAIEDLIVKAMMVF